MGAPGWAHLEFTRLFDAARRVAESAASLKLRRVRREQVESRYSNEAMNSSGSHPVRVLIQALKKLEQHGACASVVAAVSVVGSARRTESRRSSRHAPTWQSRDAAVPHRAGRRDHRLDLLVGVVTNDPVLQAQQRHLGLCAPDNVENPDNPFDHVVLLSSPLNRDALVMCDIHRPCRFSLVRKFCFRDELVCCLAHVIHEALTKRQLRAHAHAARIKKAELGVGRTLGRLLLDDKKLR